MKYVLKFMPEVAEDSYMENGQLKSDINENPTHAAYKGLRRMFFDNAIAPGQKISITDLAERFQVSPTPIVQALKLLELQGLVHHKQNKGYYTEKCTLKELEEIYEIREMIEPSLIPHSVANLDSKSVLELKTALDAHLKSLDQTILRYRSLTDMEFHFTLAVMSGKMTQLKLLKELFDFLYLKFRNRILFYEPLKTSGSDHKLVYELVSQKKTEEAMLAVRCHIKNIKIHTLKYYNEL